MKTNQHTLTLAHRYSAVLLKSALAAGLLGMITGCDTKQWFDPTQMVRAGNTTEPLVVPILSTVDPSLESANNEYVNATLPRPSDMVTSSSDYTIGRNDLITISISDLFQPGQDTIRTMRVSESGNISLPYLGAVHAEGLTEFELEKAIADAYKDAKLVDRANVAVTVVEARGRTVELLGSVNTPGQYAMLDGDFRLLDALVLAKDVTSPLIENIYVIRRSESHRTTPAGSNRPTPSILPGGTPNHPASAPSSDDLAPPKSEIPSPERGLAKASANRPLALSADAPAQDAATPASASAGAVPVTLAAAEMPAASQPFEFHGPEASGDVRVIKIPYQGLHAGDLKAYNIAIHPRDIVVVQPLAVGEYYMGGHVARPGAFTMNGRRITMKQAITSAGGFDELAIPQRTDIVRRLKPDREVYVRVNLEKVFSGEQPDIFLKPDDHIMVGTNALAPFLAAFRGAFRITYGFGFLYDRNFAYSTNSGIF